MSRALMNHTQVSVNLSLNIITRTGKQEQLVTLPIVHLTTLIFWLVVLRQNWLVKKQDFNNRASEIKQTANITGKVLSICFISLAYGIGVRQ